MAEAAIAAATAFAKWLAKEGIKQAIVKVAIQVAVAAVANKLAAEANKPRPQGSLIQLDLASDAPRRWQIGRRGNGGIMADAYSNGNKNQFAYIPIYIGEGPMGRVTGIWSQGRKVWNGLLSHGQTVTLTEFNSPDARAWVKYYDGRPGQVADAALVAENVGWSNQCIGVGVAYVILKLKWDPDTLPAIPSFFFENEGAKFYDRRKDATAGGSGSHRLKDPSTWDLSTNPEVVLDHYKLGKWLDAAAAEPVFGIGLPPEDVNFERFVAQANLCDEIVGGQKRYEANGFLFSDSTHKDTMLDLCRAMNARPADFGGRVAEISGEARTPVLVLDDADLMEGSRRNYAPKVTRAELVQKVRGTYLDAASNYNPTDYPVVGDPDWIAEDGGAIETTVVNFEMETSVVRAQRLALLYARRKRRQAAITNVWGLKALMLEDGDWFIRTGAKFGDGKTFEVNGSPKLDPATLTVTVNAFEVDPANSAWDDDEAVVPDPVLPDAEVELRLPLPSVSIDAVAYAFGFVTIPVVRFTNDDFDDGAPTGVEIQIADDLEGLPAGERIASFIPVGEETATVTGMLPAKDYLARWRSVLGDRSSIWSEWNAFATTIDYTAGGVDWSGVTGAGRPSDGADVTAANIAAGFAGEGDLARLDTVAWNSEITGRPSDLTNLVATQAFDNGVGSWGLGPTLSVAVTGQSFSHALQLEGNSVYEDNWIDVYPNARIFYRALVETLNASAGARIGIHFVNSAGGNSNFIFKVLAGGLGWAEHSGAATVPAGAVRARMFFWRANGGSGTPRMAMPYMSRHEPSADVTSGNIAAGFTGEGLLARLNAASWGSNITGRPTEFTDGRIAAGLTSTGDLARSITTGLANSSNLLRRANGGLFSGDLAADITANNISSGFAGEGDLARLNAASWGSNITGRPTELTDGRIAAGLTSTGDLARSITTGLANSSNLLRRANGGLFSGDLAADITANNISSGFAGEGDLARLNTVDWLANINGRPNDLTNLVATQAFDDGVGSWKMGGPVSAVAVAGQSFSHAVQLQGGGIYEDNWIDVSPNDRIFYRAFVETLNAPAGARVGIHYINIVGGNVLFDFITLAGGMNWAAYYDSSDVPAGAVKARMFLFRVGGSGTPRLAMPYMSRHEPGADVTGGNIAAGFSGEGSGARANSLGELDFSAGVKLSGIEAEADVTATAVPRLEVSLAAVTFQADYTGALDAGQVPRVIGARRLKGAVDVSATTTWTIPASSGVTATIDNGGTATAGTVTITAVSGTGSITVQSVRDGITLETSIAVVRSTSPPPNTGGGSGGTSAQDSSFVAMTGTSFAAVSDEMAVQTGTSGEIQFNAPLQISVAPASPSGVFEVELKWQYKAAGGSWIDAGAAVASNPDATVSYESEFNSYFSTFGSVSANVLKTGLAASTLYTVRMLGRRTASSPTKSVFLSGTASAEGA